MGMANGKDKTYYEMTPEQALDKLDKTVIGDLELKIALTKALEKQIAEKPRYLSKNNHITLRLGVFGCPNCNEYVCFKQLCCSHCGQKLDWEE